MLTLYDFNGMDEMSQAEAVFTEGVFVDDRDEDGLKAQLYKSLGQLVHYFLKFFLFCKKMATTKIYGNILSAIIIVVVLIIPIVPGVS